MSRVTVLRRGDWLLDGRAATARSGSQLGLKPFVSECPAVQPKQAMSWFALQGGGSPAKRRDVEVTGEVL